MIFTVQKNYKLKQKKNCPLRHTNAVHKSKAIKTFKKLIDSLLIVYKDVVNWFLKKGNYQ